MLTNARCYKKHYSFYKKKHKILLTVKHCFYVVFFFLLREFFEALLYPNDIQMTKILKIVLRKLCDIAAQVTLAKANIQVILYR